MKGVNDMASIEKYYNDQDVLYQLRHDLRSSPKPPRNTEIIPELTKNNYFLTPENHGRCVEECLDYYQQLLDNSYIYGRDSDREIVRCIQWSIQAPADLDPKQKPEFFASCYEYLNTIYGEQNCISAVIHTDEIMINAKGDRISHDHLHYLAVPRVENRKYISADVKFINGALKLQKYGLLTKEDDIRKVVVSINRFYKAELSKNETISKIAKETNCKYADARKIYNAVVRKDSESYKQKLNSDALTSRKQLHEFHPALQKYLDDRGIKCTVSFKSQGIERDLSYNITEAKTVTRVTGLSIEEIKGLEIENERLHEQIKSLTKELEHSKGYEKSSSWGSCSVWSKERSDHEWEY